MFSCSFRLKEPLIYSIASFSSECVKMKKLLLTSALMAALYTPALAHKENANDGNDGNKNGKGGGHTHGAPAPPAGAGLTGIAIVLGGFVICWIVSRRERQSATKEN
jgi:hypothetical protein